MDVEVKILRLPDVLARVPVSKAKLYRMMSKGAFPRPVHLGGVAVWSREAVDDWCARTAAQGQC